MRAAFQTELAAEIPSSKQLIHVHCLVKGKIVDDMNFSWVNAANILGVYDQFVNTVQDKRYLYT
jgi:hypothetical protein